MSVLTLKLTIWAHNKHPHKSFTSSKVSVSQIIVAAELYNYKIWMKTTSGGLPPAFLHDVNGPVDSTWRPTDIPIPHFEVAILDRGGQIHTVIR